MDYLMRIITAQIYFAATTTFLNFRKPCPARNLEKTKSIANVFCSPPSLHQAQQCLVKSFEV